jgi:hypothetical protein
VQIASLDVDTITAREYYTEVVSASVIYESGSTKFGNTLDDTHQVTGSLLLTGSSHQITGTLDISGTLLATAKSFDISHPTKSGMRLRYGSWEGPSNSVMITGMTDCNIINLPDYWTGLVHEDSITATLTPFGGEQHIWVEDIKENKILIGGNLTRCSYLVVAERKDIPKLVVSTKRSNMGTILGKRNINYETYGVPILDFDFAGRKKLFDSVSKTNPISFSRPVGASASPGTYVGAMG